ncbi:MAG: AAA family ATPase, partial [Eggerthellaceae bacterium]|nr:AAA family ATPase [Eggerthellaceae bacterium]
FACEVLQRALIKHAVAARDAGVEATRVIEPGDIPTRSEMMDVLEAPCGTADELMADLVGLDDVKERVREIERVTSFRARAAAEGLSLPPQNLHMALTGNAGTGKTTVARIIGRILFSVGAVPGDRFTEVQAKDLVSWYVGGTSDTTTKLIERALGGVLFIDEAYALLESSSGQEALAVLVKAMEDRKGELVVMLAGYEGPMRAFLDANPGLASRIGYRLRFEDYEPDELAEIFRRKMDAAGFSLGEGALEAAAGVLRYFHNVENFGNGRFADEVVQQVIARRATRPDGDVRTILAEDVPPIERFCELSATPVLEPSEVGDDAARWRVASHEAGHAVVGLAETGRTSIKVITIEQEGTGTLGYVQHEKKREKPLPTAADLRGELAMLMAGMAAEELECGAFSAGNGSDLAQATACARAYVASYGMSDAGLVQLVAPGAPGACPVTDLPEATLAQMNALLADALERARAVIGEHRDAFEELRGALLAGRTLTGDAIRTLWARHQGGAEADAGDDSGETGPDAAPAGARDDAEQAGALAPGEGEDDER